MNDASYRNFVNTLLNAAEDIAAAECFAGDGDTLMRLYDLTTKLRSELSPVFGVEKANRIVEIFSGAVMGAKHEREHLSSLGLLEPEDRAWL